jgi:hypothetical protein
VEQEVLGSTFAGASEIIIEAQKMKKDEDFSALALGLKSIKRARCAAHSIYCNKRARRRLINIHTRRAESSSHAAPIPPPPRKKITKSGAPSATHKERQRLNLLTAESL